MEALYAQHEMFWGIAIFFAGATLGSFINATAMRTVAGEKWWGRERSKCDSCGHILGIGDLFPIFSFIFLRGRCRYCKNKIAPRHILSEVVCGAAMSALFFAYGFSIAFAIAAVLAAFLLFNTLTDIESQYIFDLPAVLPGVLCLLLRLSGGWGAVIDGALGAALGFFFILAIIIASRGGMGFGDATLMLGAGAALGWKFCTIAMYLGFMCGGLVILPLFFMKKVSRKDAVPLGPFLAIGCFAACFAGGAVLAYFDSTPSWPWFL